MSTPIGSPEQPRLASAIRTGVTAGAIAAVIRFVFALTLEQMSIGGAIGLAVSFFVGTAVMATVIAALIGYVMARRHTP